MLTSPMRNQWTFRLKATVCRIIIQCLSVCELASLASWSGIWQMSSCPNFGSKIVQREEERTNKWMSINKAKGSETVSESDIKLRNEKGFMPEFKHHDAWRCSWIKQSLTVRANGLWQLKEKLLLRFDSFLWYLVNMAVPLMCTIVLYLTF